MMYLPKASIIVPAYNAETTLVECINSLLALDYPAEHVELIFINNASTDGTADILNQYSSAIRILSEKKRGAAAARNKGLLHAKGEIVAFTDADCVVESDWLRKIAPPLHDSSIGVVGGRILAKRPCNKTEEFGETVHDHDRAINEFTPPYAITMNWSSRLSVLKRVGMFDERLRRAQDVDLSWRILQIGYKLMFEPQAIVYHRNESNILALFREGYVHGYHSPRIHEKHKAFLRRFGVHKLKVKSPIDVLSNTIVCPQRNNTTYCICYFIFESGRSIGTFIGSIRCPCIQPVEPKIKKMFFNQDHTEKRS